MKAFKINIIFYLKVIMVLFAIYAMAFSDGKEGLNVIDYISIACLTFCLIYLGVYMVVLFIESCSFLFKK